MRNTFPAAHKDTSESIRSPPQNTCVRSSSSPPSPTSSSSSAQHRRPPRSTDPSPQLASASGSRPQNHMTISRESIVHPESKSPSISHLAPLEAILFDIDGTICDSDPIHFLAFRDMLQEVGFNDGVPITEEFFSEKISGKHNPDIGRALFPDWDEEKAMQFLDDKEVMFRRLASEKLEAVAGLHKLCKWMEERGLKRAAVTNAPRANAELMISLLGLTDFFQLLVVGSECDRAKPFPDPYLKALKELNASPSHTLVFEDSPSGIRAGVAAGMPVIGMAIRNPEQLLNDAGASFLVKSYEDEVLCNTLEELVAKK